MRANQNFVNNTNFFSMGMAAAHPGNSNPNISAGLHLGMYRNDSGVLRLAAYGGNGTFDLGAAALDTNYMIVVGLTANAGGGDTLDAWVAPDGGSLSQVLTGQALETFAGAGDVSRLVMQQHNDSNDEQVTRAWADEMRFGTSLNDVVTGGRLPFRFEIANNGANLDLEWDSKSRMFYLLRSSTDLAADLSTWDSVNVPGSVDNNGVFEIATDPPVNMHSIVRPGDPVRFYRVQEFPLPPVTVLSEDFEAGQGDWTTGGNTGSDPFTNWEFGSPSLVGPASANSGANCFATNLSADYADDADIWLRSPAIDLAAAGGATLNFSHYVDIEEGFDSGQIRLLDADAANAELAILEAVIDGNNPAGWEAFSKSLPAAALGKNVVIEFRFRSDEISDPTQAGWYIDDVTVTTPAP